MATIMPAMITPPAIMGKAYRKRIPKRNAATEPVQTPVTGKGMDTKNNKNSAPYFSYLGSCLLVLVNNQQKNKSNNFHFRKKSENGLR